MSDEQNPPIKIEESPKTAAAIAEGELRTRHASVDSEAETSLWSGGYSPKAMVGTWGAAAVVTVAAVVVAAIYLSSYLSSVLIATLVMWVLVGVVYAYRRLGVHYELTTQRFIHQSGVF